MPERATPPTPDLLSRLLPLGAAGGVLVVGGLLKYLVLDRVIANAPGYAVAAEAELVLWLVVSLGAILAALLTLLALRALQRPLRELASHLGLSTVVGAPAPLPELESAPIPLQQVVARYNALVAQVQQASAALRSDADSARARASSEEELSTLVLARVPSGILAVDAAGRVVRANEAALRILELDEPTLRTAPLAEVLGADHPLVEAARREVLRDEVHLSRTSGARVLGVSSATLQDAGGLAAGRVLVFADLTELRQLEQQLAMKERLASLGTVAAGLAHEIRNPLGALRGFVELLERRLDEPERARPLLAKIVREADALARVVGDFLDFARPAPPRKEPVDVAALLDEAREAGVAASGLTGIASALRVADDARSVPADPQQLRRALVNFVLNACQAAGAGGRVTLLAERHGASLRLGVEDSGPGVPAEQRLDVVTPFYTTKPGGTGLGLAIAHQIARAHGGQLCIEDAPGGGARVLIELPLA